MSAVVPPSKSASVEFVNPMPKRVSQVPARSAANDAGASSRPAMHVIQRRMTNPPSKLTTPPSILVEHLLDPDRILGLRERELQQHPRLGRIQFPRRHEPHLIVVDLIVAQHDALG